MLSLQQQRINSNFSLYSMVELHLACVLDVVQLLLSADPEKEDGEEQMSVKPAVKGGDKNEQKFRMQNIARM